MEVKNEQQQASEGSVTLIESTQLLGTRISPRKKLKTSPAPANTQIKANPSQATQGVRKPRGRPKKENVSAGSSEKKLVGSTQSTTGSPKKSTRAKAAVSPSKKKVPAPAPQTAVSPTKQKRLMVTLPSPGKMENSDLDGSRHTPSNAAERVKASPRKVAAAPPFKAMPKPLNSRSKNRQASPSVDRGGDDGELLAEEDDELLFA